MSVFPQQGNGKLTVPPFSSGRLLPIFFTKNHLPSNRLRHPPRGCSMSWRGTFCLIGDSVAMVGSAYESDSCDAGGMLPHTRRPCARGNEECARSWYMP